MNHSTQPMKRQSSINPLDISNYDASEHYNQSCFVTWTSFFAWQVEAEYSFDINVLQSH